MNIYEYIYMNIYIFAPNCTLFSKTEHDPDQGLPPQNSIYIILKQIKWRQLLCLIIDVKIIIHFRL